MQAVYPVLFTKTEDCILVEVPDLEVLTEGKDMKNAIDMARDAMELTCVTLEDHKKEIPAPSDTCLLYTSDAADEARSVDLGGRRIIKKRFFSSRRRHTRSSTVSWARRCV